MNKTNSRNKICRFEQVFHMSVCMSFTLISYIQNTFIVLISK